jgi:amylosucrase
MGHALIASFGGLPLLYMGDEVGLLNDAGFLADPALAGDGRWMQRPPMDWALAAVEDGPQARVREGTRAILVVRKATPQLAGTVPTRVIETGHRGVFGYLRTADDRQVTCLCNFTEHGASVDVDLPKGAVDLLTGQPPMRKDGGVALGPYQAVWLRA